MTSCGRGNRGPRRGLKHQHGWKVEAPRKDGIRYGFPYCDVHERLFDPQHQAWITWPRMWVEMVQRLCDQFDAEHITGGDGSYGPHQARTVSPTALPGGSPDASHDTLA
jgi:hypothetical protein